MKIPQLESCCCGCSLELGSKIIGWIQFVGLILAIIGGIVTEFAVSSVDTKTTGSDTKQNDEFAKEVVQIFMLIVLVYFVIALFFTILLLLGIYKKRPSYVMVWIIVTCIGNVVLILGTIGKLFGQHVVAAQIIGDIIGIVLNLYCLLVVYSYYRVMKGTHNMSV